MAKLNLQGRTSQITSKAEAKTLMAGPTRTAHLNTLRQAVMHLCAVVVFFSASGCMTAYRKTVVGQTPQVFERIFLTDFNTAWSGVKEALKSSRIDVENREGGMIQTRWTDNTSERNFVDSFGAADIYLKAKFRLKINLAAGAYNGRPSVRITVQRDQLVSKDVLEGWKPVESDSIEENTLLYRISRIVFMRMKMTQIDEDRKRRELEETKF